jgi:hypothetical protein
MSLLAWTKQNLRRKSKKLHSTLSPWSVQAHQQERKCHYHHNQMPQTYQQENKDLAEPQSDLYRYGRE